MYFTIPLVDKSSPLSDDAQESVQRLGHHAVALSGLSGRIAPKALAAAQTYTRALEDGRPDSWALFVAAAATLTSHSDELASFLHLSAREREARDFFAQIVRENGDLLPEVAAAA